MKSRQNLPLHEAWVIFFALGVVMLNYPFLHIFNKNVQILGIPLILLYLLLGWPLSIAVIYWFSHALTRTPPKEKSKKKLPPPEDER